MCRSSPGRGGPLRTSSPAILIRPEAEAWIAPAVARREPRRAALLSALGARRDLSHAWERSRRECASSDGLISLSGSLAWTHGGRGCTSFHSQRNAEPERLKNRSW